MGYKVRVWLIDLRSKKAAVALIFPV